MTLDIKKIWDSTNKVLTTINEYLLALVLMGSGPVTKVHKRKIPLVFSIILLLVLAFIVFILTYGAYRRVND